jgi:microcompartment protein CcmL/EutN
MADALGMIETRSFPAVVEAADAMVKAAKVELVSYEKTSYAVMSLQLRQPVMQDVRERRVSAKSSRSMSLPARILMWIQ